MSSHPLVSAPNELRAGPSALGVAIGIATIVVVTHDRDAAAYPHQPPEVAS